MFFFFFLIIEDIRDVMRLLKAGLEGLGGTDLMCCFFFLMNDLMCC